MNWLAHILLSKQDVEYQIGNFLADPLKGRAWENASTSIEQGMLMHKAIDIFTDSHKIVSLSKSRLGDSGYLKGVIIDLLYDHFLSVHWDQYAKESKRSFLNTFYEGANHVSDSYPDEVKFFVSKIVQSDMLAKYQSFEGFVESLHRIERRLSDRIKTKDSALNYIEVVEHQYDLLEQDFKLFFPDLVEYFVNHDLGSFDDNFLV